MPIGVILPAGGLRPSVFWDIQQHISATTKTLTASKHMLTAKYEVLTFHIYD